jgi:hypothetical protein
MYFVLSFLQIREENYGQNKLNAIFEIFRRFYAIEENDGKKQKRN